VTKIISFLNRKGGTGKTTSAINAGCILQRQGFETTIIETDANHTLGEGDFSPSRVKKKFF